MSTIYSALIWTGHVYSAGTESFTLSGAPLLYVIRDVDVETGSAFNGYLEGFRLTVAGDALFTLGIGFTEPGRTFHWRGRSVATPGNVLAMVNNDDNYLSWRVSGYAFT